MKINMSEKQFNKFIELVRSSKKEIGGIMHTQVHNGEIYIVDVELDGSNMIESSSPSKIVYNYKEYLTRTIYELAFSNSPVYIRFHTHPSFGGAPGLSKQDIYTLKYTQGLTQKVKKINSNNCPKVVSAIITSSEIAFYTYDLDSDKIVRLPFFVDGIEKIPSLEKSKFQVFKEAFIEGRKRARK